MLTVDVPHCLPVLSVPTHTPHPPLQLRDWHWAEHTDTVLHFSRQPARVFVMVGERRRMLREVRRYKVNTPRHSGGGDYPPLGIV